MRLDAQKERDFYVKEAGEQNGSSRLLERNIRSGYYKRLLSSQRKKGVSNFFCLTRAQ
jgi:predicted nuclease of restriction endonuclease-like (RecB) superfamily